jgi:hypothetical protein
MINVETFQNIGFVTTQILFLVCFFAALWLGRSKFRPPGWLSVVLGSALLAMQAVLQFGGALLASLQSESEFKAFHSIFPIFSLAGIVGAILVIVGISKAVFWLKCRDSKRPFNNQ